MCGSLILLYTYINQVISLDLRTNLSEGKGVKVREGNNVGGSKKTGAIGDVQLTDIITPDNTLPLHRLTHLTVCDILKVMWR